MDAKNGIDNGKTRKGKAAFDLFKPVSVRPDGQRIESANWCVRFQHQGKRTCRSLGTADYRLAQQHAKALVNQVRGHGWEAVTKIRGERDSILIEDLISLFEEKAPGRGIRPRTVDAYVKAMREIAGAIGAKRVADLKPERVQAYVDEMTADGLAVPTIRSRIPNAGGIFAKKTLAVMGLTDLVNPFSKVIFPKADKGGFKSPDRAVITKLMGDGLKELTGPARLGFALALGVGLRWHEAATMDWLNVGGDTVHVLATLAKGRKARTIPMGDTVKAALDAARKPAGPVLDDPVLAHAEITVWLRDRGITDAKPCHWLRKCFGSLAVGDHGVFVGSKLLGHAEISQTITAYSDLVDKLPAVNF